MIDYYKKYIKYKNKYLKNKYLKNKYLKFKGGGAPATLFYALYEYHRDVNLKQKKPKFNIAPAMLEYESKNPDNIPPIIQGSKAHLYEDNEHDADTGKKRATIYPGESLVELMDTPISSSPSVIWATNQPVPPPDPPQKIIHNDATLEDYRKDFSQKWPVDSNGKKLNALNVNHYGEATHFNKILTYCSSQIDTYTLGATRVSLWGFYATRDDKMKKNAAAQAWILDIPKSSNNIIKQTVVYLDQNTGKTKSARTDENGKIYGEGERKPPAGSLGYTGTGMMLGILGALLILCLIISSEDAGDGLKQNITLKTCQALSLQKKTHAKLITYLFFKSTVHFMENLGWTNRAICLVYCTVENNYFIYINLYKLDKNDVYEQWKDDKKKLVKSIIDESINENENSYVKKLLPTDDEIYADDLAKQYLEKGDIYKIKLLQLHKTSGAGSCANGFGDMNALMIYKIYEEHSKAFGGAKVFDGGMDGYDNGDDVAVVSAADNDDVADAVVSAADNDVVSAANNDVAARRHLYVRRRAAADDDEPPTQLSRTKSMMSVYTSLPKQSYMLHLIQLYFHENESRDPPERVLAPIVLDADFLQKNIMEFSYEDDNEVYCIDLNLFKTRFKDITEQVNDEESRKAHEENAKKAQKKEDWQEEEWQKKTGESRLSYGKLDRLSLISEIDEKIGEFIKQHHLLQEDFELRGDFDSRLTFKCILEYISSKLDIDKSYRNTLNEADANSARRSFMFSKLKDYFFSDHNQDLDDYTNIYIVCIGYFLVNTNNDVLNLLLDLFHSDIPIHDIMCALFNMLQWNNLLEESIKTYLSIYYKANEWEEFMTEMVNHINSAIKLQFIQSLDLYDILYTIEKDIFGDISKLKVRLQVADTHYFHFQRIMITKAFVYALHEKFEEDLLQLPDIEKMIQIYVNSLQAQLSMVNQIKAVIKAFITTPDFDLSILLSKIKFPSEIMAEAYYLQQKQPDSLIGIIKKAFDNALSEILKENEDILKEQLDDLYLHDYHEQVKIYAEKMILIYVNSLHAQRLMVVEIKKLIKEKNVICFNNFDLSMLLYEIELPSEIMAEAYYLQQMQPAFLIRIITRAFDDALSEIIDNHNQILDESINDMLKEQLDNLKSKSHDYQKMILIYVNSLHAQRLMVNQIKKIIKEFITPDFHLSLLLNEIITQEFDLSMLLKQIELPSEIMAEAYYLHQKTDQKDDQKDDQMKPNFLISIITRSFHNALSEIIDDQILDKPINDMWKVQLDILKLPYYKEQIEIYTVEMIKLYEESLADTSKSSNSESSSPVKSDELLRTASGFSTSDLPIASPASTITPPSKLPIKRSHTDTASTDTMMGGAEAKARIDDIQLNPNALFCLIEERIRAIKECKKQKELKEIINKIDGVVEEWKNKFAPTVLNFTTVEEWKEKFTTGDTGDLDTYIYDCYVIYMLSKKILDTLERDLRKVYSSASTSPYHHHSVSKWVGYNTYTEYLNDFPKLDYTKLDAATEEKQQLEATAEATKAELAKLEAEAEKKLDAAKTEATKAELAELEAEAKIKLEAATEEAQAAMATLEKATEEKQQLEAEAKTKLDAFNREMLCKTLIIFGNPNPEETKRRGRSSKAVDTPDTTDISKYKEFVEEKFDYQIYVKAEDEDFFKSLATDSAGEVRTILLNQLKEKKTKELKDKYRFERLSTFCKSILNVDIFNQFIKEFDKPTPPKLDDKIFVYDHTFDTMWNTKSDSHMKKMVTAFQNVFGEELLKKIMEYSKIDVQNNYFASKEFENPWSHIDDSVNIASLFIKDMLVVSEEIDLVAPNSLLYPYKNPLRTLREQVKKIKNKKKETSITHHRYQDLSDSLEFLPSDIPDINEIFLYDLSILRVAICQFLKEIKNIEFIDKWNTSDEEILTIYLIAFICINMHTNSELYDVFQQNDYNFTDDDFVSKLAEALYEYLSFNLIPKVPEVVDEEEDAKKAQEEEDAKKAQEEEDAKKAQEEEDAKKAQEEEDAKNAQEEEDAKKAQEEEDAKKAQEEEDVEMLEEEEKKKEEEEKKKEELQKIIKKFFDDDTNKRKFLIMFRLIVYGGIPFRPKMIKKTKAHESTKQGDATYQKWVGSTIVMNQLWTDDKNRHFEDYVNRIKMEGRAWTLTRQKNWSGFDLTDEYPKHFIFALNRGQAYKTKGDFEQPGFLREYAHLLRQPDVSTNFNFKKDEYYNSNEQSIIRINGDGSVYLSNVSLFMTTDSSALVRHIFELLESDSPIVILLQWNKDNKDSSANPLKDNWDANVFNPIVRGIGEGSGGLLFNPNIWKQPEGRFDIWMCNHS